MKKLISICLCAIMMLTMLPVGVYAAESDFSERDELIALACEVFPEYAYLILSDASSVNIKSPRTSDTSNVIMSQTRNISDTESLTISQLSSGSVIIIQQSTSSFPITIVDSSTSDISNVGVSGTASFKMTCTGGLGTFYLNNVRFTIYYNASDYFTNTGTASYDNNVLLGDVNTSSTFIDYNIVFNAQGHQLQGTFWLYFSNNQLIAEAR